MWPTIGAITSPQDLFSQLVSLRAGALYGIFAQTCLHEFIKQCASGRADPNALITELPEGKVSLKQFMDSLAAAGDKELLKAKRTANVFLTRNLLKEGFRITQSFCENNGLRQAIEGEQWYLFTRIVVNSLSHDFCLRFRPSDKKRLPVSYRGETIDESMDGKEIRMPLAVLLGCFDDIVTFVKNTLM